MATTRVEMNGDTVGQFLRGDVGTIAKDLERRGRAVARRAGSAYNMVSRPGRNRWRVTVGNVDYDPDPRSTLTVALDAGRSE
jgi:hypothetical protein